MRGSALKVVTAEMMREMDRRAIEEFGIPGVVLMENAGRAVVEVIQREYGPLRGKRVAIFCGSGNNGGDGFVIARYLHLAGASPFVVLVGRPEALKDDARVHFDLLSRLDIRVHDVSGDDWSGVHLNRSLVVDALLGTGIKDAPRGAYEAAIEIINHGKESHGPISVIAVDIPSGVDADTGATPGEAIWADCTVTFGYPKLGHLLFPGTERVGKLHVADIGFDWRFLEAASDQESSYRWLNPPDAYTDTQKRHRWRVANPAALCLLQKRGQDTNKGDYGHVGIIAGSRGMAGAPALTARAAQRAGAGLVTVLAPMCVQPMIAAKLDEQMTIPLPDAEGALSEAAFDAIANFAEKASVLCIGPGLTTSPQTVALVQRLIAEIEKPIVLDADGLNALAKQPDVALRRREDSTCPLIITPHPGEAARLLETSIENVQSNRIEAVRELARKFRAVALLKGRHTLTADPKGQVAINTTGNPGMATGGSGDILTGILGGLVAQAVARYRNAPSREGWLSNPIRTRDVVELGTMLHGMAGDIAAEKFGETALTAGDITACLPEAFRRLEETE
jgi:ADP-dependent NAD(P)H-hydrate dehydratase / NAD(P)H-hydrate epimerase